MKFLQFIVVGAIIGLVVGMLNLPSYTIAIAAVVLFIGIMGNFFYVTMYTKNLKKIEKVIKSNRKNPIYRSLQLLAEGTDEEFEESLEVILKKYKNTKYEGTYGALLAMMRGDFEQAHRYNERLLHKEVGQYTNYIIDIVSGKEIEDVPAFKQSWMNSSIEAHKAFMSHDVHAFEDFSKQATEQAKGIQYYGNYYTFKRMRNKLSEEFQTQ
ncbi:hypothetical protein [Solibacillus daqui]|uniref:hypothetical protein n=1 Tax=Solibacillus daqui TaxID=2912187 RepID=UPI00236667F2|nr:hypothetical protein [Solibacillus daqui]